MWTSLRTPQPSARSVGVLEARPVCHRNRCTPDDLVQYSGIRVSPVLLDRNVPLQATNSSDHPLDCSNLATPVMVPQPCSRHPSFSQHRGTFSGTHSGRHTPSCQLSLSSWPHARCQGSPHCNWKITAGFSSYHGRLDGAKEQILRTSQPGRSGRIGVYRGILILSELFYKLPGLSLCQRAPVQHGSISVVCHSWAGGRHTSRPASSCVQTHEGYIQLQTTGTQICYVMVCRSSDHPHEEDGPQQCLSNSH